MGRIQSSIGLITGTNIVGTVDQLIAISGQPRDRLVSRTETLQREQKAIAELTASVIGVQLAGNKLAGRTAFHSKTAESSNSESLSAVAGSQATPGSHVIRTLRTAATHSVQSLARFASTDEAVGLSGVIRINPAGGLIDGSTALSGLNGGRGVEAGTIRITDRSGASAEIDLRDARTIDDVLDAINDAEIDVRATTTGSAITLTDLSGGDASHLKVEQLGDAETAADLGLWGIDVAASSVTGTAIELPPGVHSLRGAALSELNGGRGIAPLTNLNITLSDGSSAVIDLSAATTTSEVIDAIDNAGLSLIVGLNDARNGIRIRDTSGGSGNLTISSSDHTAGSLGIAGTTSDDILVGANLNRQTVTADTLLSDLNQNAGIHTGSFTVTDSSGAIGAVNLKAQGITTLGELIDAINQLGIGVSASLNDAGDGIAVVNTAGGGGTLSIQDSGSGTTAAELGIAGTATQQTVGGALVSALVGTQADVITVQADDTLESIVARLNDHSRYASAAVNLQEDGSYTISLRSKRGGESGRIAINTTGFDLDLRTGTRGQDAQIAVSTDGGPERFLTSSDGVFKLDGPETNRQIVTGNTLLSELPGAADRGSFTITDSSGVTSAINLTAQQISTVGQLVDAINQLGIGATASINDARTGIAILDTAGGSETLTIKDVGNSTAASSLGIAGAATLQTVGGNSVPAVVGPAVSEATAADSGLVLTLKALSASPVTVTVAEDSSAVVSAVETFANQYNRLVEKLASLTFFDAEKEQVGLLFGSSEALRISSGYSRLLSGSIRGAGEFRSISQIGLRLNDQGKLDFDGDKLTEALQSKRGEVEEFFTTDQTGLVDRLSDLADRMAGASSGLLLNRGQTLSEQIESNGERIDRLNARLAVERERLLLQFYRTEEAIAKIQSSQSAIEQIQRITFPTAG
jgi:flagellar hook-associated protein 2